MPSEATLCAGGVGVRRGEVLRREMPRPGKGNDGAG